MQEKSESDIAEEEIAVAQLVSDTENGSASEEIKETIEAQIDSQCDEQELHLNLQKSV